MRQTACVLGMVIGSVSAVAATPNLFFAKDDLPALRDAVARPDLAAAWGRILKDAQGFCDPASPQYADLEDPFRFGAKGERLGESRYNALLVHQVGRILTARMEAIGFAYQVTGREDLGKHGAAFLATAARLYPVSHEQVSKGFAGGRGDIMRGLALGFDWLAERLEPEQRRQVAEVGAGYVEFFLREFDDPKQWFHKVHNYNGVNGGSAGCLALALRDEFPDRYARWSEASVRIIQRWLDAGFDQQGAYLEGVGYSGYGLTNTVLFAHALRRSGGPDLLAHPVFPRLAEFYALSLLPGEGVYDARNDSSYAGLGTSLLGLCGTPAGGLYRWLWERTGTQDGVERILLDNAVPPVDPVAAHVPTAQHFAGRGLCTWRTGWSETDVMFAIEAGPYYPVTHNQADKGHVTLYGLGQRWATDPGYANENSPTGRGQTLAHSCILIDGKGQARSGAGLGSNGRIAAYENSGRRGYALADCTEAYNRNNKGEAGAGAHHAFRHSLFVYPKDRAPAYAVVLDDIARDEANHEYTWQLMLAPAMQVTLGDGRAEIAPPVASGGAHIQTPLPAAPGTSAGAQATAPADQGRAVLEFGTDTPGEYILWARVRTLAETVVEADSFFVQVDDGQEVAWHMPGRHDWTWGRVASGVPATAVSYPLSPGPHRLTVRRREAGAQMDCLWLTRDPQAVATDAAVRTSGIFLEAEAGTLTAPMVVERATAPARLIVRLDAPAPVRLTTDEFVPDDYHAPTPFPRLRGVTQAVNPEFMAVLLPLPPGTTEPEVTFSRDAAERRVRIDWGTHADVIAWPRDGRTPALAEP